VRLSLLSSYCDETTTCIEAKWLSGFFKKEVQKVYLGEGQEFRGEGILAVTKVLMKLSIGSRP